MGSRKKPIEMCLGNRTKAEIEERREQESYLKGDSKISKNAPSYLSTNAKKIYKNIVKNLPDDFLNSNDTYVIASCADALDKMEQCIININTNGVVIETSKGDVKNNPAVATYEKYFNIFNKLCSQIGLSPSARAKIMVVPKDTEKDAFEELLEGLN